MSSVIVPTDEPEYSLDFMAGLVSLSRLIQVIISTITRDRKVIPIYTMTFIRYVFLLNFRSLDLK